MRTRIAGASLVMTSMAATFILRAVMMVPPTEHPARPMELLLAALAILAGLPGLAMLVDGPALFGRADMPVRRRGRPDA